MPSSSAMLVRNIMPVWICWCVEAISAVTWLVPTQSLTGGSLGCGVPLGWATAGGTAVFPCPASAPLQAVNNKAHASAPILVSVRNVLFIPDPFSCATTDVVAVGFVAHD